MDVWYLVGTVLTKEIDPWKKIPLCARRPPAARKNAFSHYISHLPMPIGSRATRGFLRYVEYEFFRAQDRQNYNIDAVFCRITSGWRAKRASRELRLKTTSHNDYSILSFIFKQYRTNKCNWIQTIFLPRKKQLLLKFLYNKGNF